MIDRDTGVRASTRAGVPLVTVVIPLFNGSAHIAETLTSVSRQTFRDFEVIVVDDGSTDDGRDVTATHEIEATLLTQDNLGVAVARNRGLAAARSRWITFLDQDDLWHPTHLERLMAWLALNPHERVAFVRETPFTTVDEVEALAAIDDNAGGWAHVRVPTVGTLDALIHSAFPSELDRVEIHDLRSMLRGPISATTSFIAEAELLRLAGGFAPHALAMDDYWLLVNVSRLHPIVQLPQRSVYYRVHVRATSRTTRLGLPFLSSAVALRFGGGLIPREEALRGGLEGKLHHHLLLELRRAPEYRSRRFRVVVDSLAEQLWPGDRRSGDRARAHAKSAFPWLSKATQRVRSTSRAREGR